MKYIVLETEDGRRLPIIFPDVLVHAHVAGAMQLVIDCLDPKKDLRPRQCERMLEGASAKPVSAGFIAIQDVEVSGRSESLGNLAHNPADKARIVLGDAISHADDSMAQSMLAMWERKQALGS